MEKLRDTGGIPRYTEYQKFRRQINCGKNYLINSRLDLGTMFA